jgi:hypothetical protein
MGQTALRAEINGNIGLSCLLRTIHALGIDDEPKRVKFTELPRMVHNIDYSE